MDTDAAGQLQAILVADGPELAHDPARLAERLTEVSPGRPLEVELLVAAAEQGTPPALLDRTGPPMAERIDVLSQDLTEALDVSPEFAEWAVRTWAFALGTGEPSPGNLPAPRAGAGRPAGSGGRRTRLLLAGAAAVTLVAALAVLIPQLASGFGGEEKAGPSGDAGSPTPSTPSSVTQDLVVLAHQGGWEKYPLETLPALVAAAKSGATVETDVHWTSDGVAVLVHDDLTTPADEAGAEHPMVCQGGPYTVSKTRWEVLRTNCRTLASASKDGRRYPIPTFDAAMKAIAAVPDAQVVVEMKPERPTAAQISEYLDTITKHAMAERTIASSFSAEALTRIRAQAEQDSIALRYLLMLRPSSDQDEDLPTPDQLSNQQLWGVALRSDIATRGNVAGLRAKKLAVVVWTVNTEDEWNAAKLAQADLVLTDKPGAYQAWLP